MKGRFALMNGARMAVVLSFDVDAEAVWIDRDPRNRDRPVVLSHGTYGPRVGVPLLLDLLARYGLKATFFVPGWTAEQHADAIRAIAGSGHEIGHHGYLHETVDGLPPAAEEEILLRTSDFLERLVGARPRGYRAPHWDLTPNSVGLLAKHGFLYSSNMMDDFVPYLHPGSTLVEVPVHWTLDDGVYFTFVSHPPRDRQIYAPSTVLSAWRDAFHAYHRHGGCFVLTMHPQTIGRPERLDMLETLLREMRETDGVWFATAAEVADYCRAEVRAVGNRP
jgi:peptidoglycan/xylan/chitin deacetylase (PgdA/CDA1 family)